MKNVQSLLVLFSIIAPTSCAHAMGPRRCEDRELPERPVYEICVSSGNGSAGCYDPRANPSSYVRPEIRNYVCIPPESYNEQENWLRYILETCGK